MRATRIVISAVLWSLFSFVTVIVFMDNLPEISDSWTFLFGSLGLSVVAVCILAALPGLLVRRWGITETQCWILIGSVAGFWGLSLTVFMIIIPLEWIFGFFLMSGCLFHYVAWCSRKDISPDFYKRLEYLYVLSSIVGMLSVVEPMAQANANLIRQTGLAVEEAKAANERGDCMASAAPKECDDFDSLPALERDIAAARARTLWKIDPRIKIIGYLLLILAINTKLLKITGELYGWHNGSKKP